MKRILPYFLSGKTSALIALPAFFCSLWLMGCETLVDDLDRSRLPTSTSKLVVECLLSPQSDVIRVVVTESQPLFGPASYSPTFIARASVVLSDGEKEIAIPYVDSTFTYTVDSGRFPIEAGKKYRLSVSDGVRSVTASCVVPREVIAPRDYELDSLPVSDNPGARRFRLQFRWDDPPGIKNYYSVFGYATIREAVYNPDPPAGEPDTNYHYRQHILQHDVRGILVSDRNLDGTTFRSPRYELSLYGYHVNPSGPGEPAFFSHPTIARIHYEVRNLDENYYRFYYAYNNADNDNPFVEPTLIPSNIEGGLGCFGAYTTGVLDVEL